MSEVPKGRRNHSKLDAQILASDVRRQITTEIMVTFGYSQKKYEEHIKALTGYIQNPEERDAAAETIRKLEENFEGWFIVKERDRMFQLACDIPSHLRAANAIFPKIHGEYVERRLHLDKAIACCYRLQEELQFTATTLPSDYNKFTRLVLDLDHEANLIKKLRRSDETGSNEGYILLWDYSGYYANIPHEKCLDTINGFLDREPIDPQERQLTKEIMANTLQSFEMDVSRFSDKEVTEMYRQKVDPLLNAGVPAAQLTGEKWLRKGVDIGNQQSQDIGIVYPYRVDNFCKIVCGFRHFGRYTDDSYIIHRSKEKLLQAFEGIKKIAAEYGLIINERKTRICKLSDTYRHLQIQYSLTASGRLIRKINPKAVTRERRKLKAYKRLLDAGRMAYSKIEDSFKSWIASVYKYMSRQQIQGLSRLFYDLFGKAPTWKKTHGSSHGRLRWMMALPSAA